ncbi:MAG: MazG nucleotide pyrophosphohydrolase domain-containing protein [Candidatus Thalassarchaeaceae archaeon]|nr:MazG nucleotide pyrophosphohydrolase domain-containing protein [Candidatus Thalassarchaeaceae archaeon]|tara:strand:- start:186 stop:572 length:387 start_codon:yes stop_codon:yes gene_type:complete
MKPLSVEDWMNIENLNNDERSWNMMMHKVASFHSKFDFDNPENKGHDMGYRIALTVEELGEFAAAITKEKPLEEAAEELADILILILGHSLALKVDLYDEFCMKMEKIMNRPAIKTKLGIRVTEYKKE